jgi:hypothetical protein
MSKRFEHLGKILNKEEQKVILGGEVPEFCCMLYCYDSGFSYLGKVSIGNECGTNPPGVCQSFYPSAANVACICGIQDW